MILIFEYLGEHSLEIYISNVIVCQTIRSIELPSIGLLPQYLILHLIIVPCIICLSKLMISNKLKKFPTYAKKQD